MLNARFLQNGMQILSAAADGLVKLWQVRTADCAATFEEHEGKIWAMDSAVQKTEEEEESFLVTGGEKLVVWRDCTAELEEQKAQEEVDNRQQQVGGRRIMSGGGARIWRYGGGICLCGGS